ncbi:hypothetical protein OH77DRAFT_544073 [Trametes cingulata]|nr:hypothetical protein OH77DRAFT_544073 [Trametes cingulata]
MEHRRSCLHLFGPVLLQSCAVCAPGRFSTSSAGCAPAADRETFQPTERVRLCRCTSGPHHGDVLALPSWYSCRDFVARKSRTAAVPRRSLPFKSRRSLDGDTAVQIRSVAHMRQDGPGVVLA